MTVADHRLLDRGHGVALASPYAARRQRPPVRRSPCMSAHAHAHAHTASPSSQARALRHRKSVENLSTAQLKALRDSFAAAEALADDRGFGHWAGIHGLPLPMYCQHGTRLFLPWHRAYLYFFELALRDLVPDTVLAWWDWTSAGSHANGIPAAFAQAKVGNTANPLYQTTVPPVARQNNQPQKTTRDPGSPGDLPTGSQVQQGLSLPDFQIGC